ncbi:MAG: B12-binding domain-containing radical SAM protein [Candidatus Nealsonbacteria bacterium]|nr:B12-binding domain-containing radical SAM protein [Candidatus Nealsonbacteria bacterium]
MTPIKITLIMPGVGCKPGEPYVRGWKMQPLSLAVLAALTPSDVDLRFVDDRVEPIPYDTPTDAVAISVETYTARRAYQIAESFRARGVPVILGGYHPTLVPDEASGFADAIVIGEAETVWGRVIEDCRRNQLGNVYRSDARPALDGLQPRREIFQNKPYLPLTLIETGRGCRFACDFCSVSCFFRQTYRARPVTDIVAEIEACGNQTVFFTDDNIVADFDRARRLFQAIRPLGINWLSQGSVNMADDLAMLKLMRQSGCRGILVGFESLSDETLVRMGKGWNQTMRDYSEAVSRIRDSGIAVYATFVFGYDTDTPDAIDRAVEFAIGQKFFMAAFNHLVPFPGTPVYSRLEREGRLRFDRWWLQPEYRFGDVAFKPRHMTAEQLAQRCYKARRDFYRFGSVMTRAMDLRANCADVRAAISYLWINLFSGREARKRQGLPLGEGLEGKAA